MKLSFKSFQIIIFVDQDSSFNLSIYESNPGIDFVATIVEIKIGWVWVFDTEVLFIFISFHDIVFENYETTRTELFRMEFIHPVFLDDIFSDGIKNRNGHQFSVDLSDLDFH